MAGRHDSPATPAGSLVANACDRARQMLRAGTSRRDVLTQLATAGEVVAGAGSAVSILVLGTFGTYFQLRREPSADERDAVRDLAGAAALAIEGTGPRATQPA